MRDEAIGNNVLYLQNSNELKSYFPLGLDFGSDIKTKLMMAVWQEVAAYMASELAKQRNVDKIDLMTLNKVMYFAQRESYVRTDRPLFEENIFHAAQYGPVIIKLKGCLKRDDLTEMPCDDWLQEHESVLRYVINHYGKMSAHTLSSLSHSEISWRNAQDRAGKKGPYQRISDADIRLDAMKIRIREEKLRRKDV